MMILAVAPCTCCEGEKYNILSEKRFQRVFTTTASSSCLTSHCFLSQYAHYTAAANTLVDYGCAQDAVCTACEVFTITTERYLFVRVLVTEPNPSTYVYSVPFH